MTINMQSAQKLIEMAESDMNKFTKGLAGKPQWMGLEDAINDDKTPENIISFALELEEPLQEGSAQDFANYYSRAIAVIQKHNVPMDKVLFSTDKEGYNCVQIEVTPLNKTSKEEYYKQIVWHKGQLIGCQRQAEKEIEKLNLIHKEYTKDLDDNIKEALAPAHAKKLLPFKQIDDTLQICISKLEKEEWQNKPLTKVKIK